MPHATATSNTTTTTTTHQGSAAAAACFILKVRRQKALFLLEKNGRLRVVLLRMRMSARHNVGERQKVTAAVAVMMFQQEAIIAAAIIAAACVAAVVLGWSHSGRKRRRLRATDPADAFLDDCGSLGEDIQIALRSGYAVAMIIVIVIVWIWLLLFPHGVLFSVNGTNEQYFVLLVQYERCVMRSFDDDGSCFV